MRHQRKAIRSLQALLPDLAKTNVVDIGANPTEQPPYRPLLQTNQAQVYGFEPDPRAFAALEKAPQDNFTCINAAVGDGQKHTLFVCQASYMTSLLRPSASNDDLFPQMARGLRVKDEAPIQTRALDDISEIDSLDILKIDVQGGELAVFRNGRKKLSKAVCVQTEVSFFPLYENQPGFGEIDVELRKLGFLPHSMPVLHRNPVSPFQAARRHGRQLVDGDIVYLRDLRKMRDLSIEQIKQLAVAGVGFLDAPDVTMRALTELANRAVISDADVGAFAERFPPQNGRYAL